MKSSGSFGTGGRLKMLVAGTLAVAGLAIALPAGASASPVECNGNAIAPADSKGKAFGYDFKCFSPLGDATNIEAYSIVSSHPISGFNTEPIVVNTEGGVTVAGESFQCEGDIPGDGFGCFGKASLGNEVRGGFSLTRNPCSKRTLSKYGKWRLWVVASAPKVNPNTGAKTPTVSDPRLLKVPACAPEPEANKQKK